MIVRAESEMVPAPDKDQLIGVVKDAKAKSALAPFGDKDEGGEDDEPEESKQSSQDKKSMMTTRAKR